MAMHRPTLTTIEMLAENCLRSACFAAVFPKNADHACESRMHAPHTAILKNSANLPKERVCVCERETD